VGYIGQKFFRQTSGNEFINNVRQSDAEGSAGVNGLVRRFLALARVLALFICASSIIPGPCAAAGSGSQGPIAADYRAFGIARAGLQRAVEFARLRPDLFGPGTGNKKGLLTREDRLAIWNTWSSVLDSVAALDAIRNGVGKAGLVREEDRCGADFALSYACFLAGYRHGLEFIALTDRNHALDTVLDEAVPELGITAGTFGRFKFRFLNVAAATEFSALEIVDKSCPDNGPKELRTAIDEDSGIVWKMGKGKGPALTVKNALAIARKTAFAAWFPVQKNVSEWMGDTQVHRRGTHLISREQVNSMAKRLEPGDILFERHEWYLSNMGLPGFWTHSALYVGTPEERRAFFSDPETTAWVRSRGINDGDIEKLLKDRYPKAYAAATSPAENGHSPRVLEAISEGVSFTSLEHSCAADSIGVVRPRLTKAEKGMAILRAFHYWGRPYDFNFDFATDSSLVCSELVYKAYEPAPGMKGIRFPVSEIMGRKVSTPNNMVRSFDEQYGSVDAQSDFALFLDGFEKERRAVESTCEQFRKSWRRPNWHILIQKPPEQPAGGK